jgi:hypothetical protein
MVDLLSKPPKRLTDKQVLLGLAAMTAVALFVALWTARTVNPLRGDSYEYLYFDPSRSVGYPAFLALIRLITGQVALAVPAQTLLLAGSLLALGWSFYKFCGRASFSFVFMAIVLSLAAMWYDSAFLMTESMSTALVAVWCAQLLRMINAPPSIRGTALLVTVSALATMVRPSLIALFFAAAIFLFVTQSGRERWWSLLAVGAGLVLAWGATPVAQLLVHGSARTTSPFARGVLQHTLFCDPDAVPRDADAQFVEQSAAPVRRYIETAPPHLQRQLRRSYSTLLRMSSIIPVLGRRHHLDMRSQVDPYLSRIANERVRANPSCYATSVLGEYARMAIFASDPTTADARRFNAFIQTHPPVEVTQYPRLPGDEQWVRRAANEVHKPFSQQPERQDLKVSAKAPLLAILPIRIVFGGAALLGLLSLLGLPFKRRLPPQFQQIVPATAAMGVVFHGTLIITAIVEIGFFRYLVPVWPIVCTLVAVMAVGLVNWPRRGPATATPGLTA